MNTRLRYLLVAISVPVMLVSLWYLGRQFIAYRDVLFADRVIASWQVAWGIGTTVFYMVSQLALSEAWHHTVACCMPERPRRRHTHVAFLSSIIGKYFPTGFMHFIGRHGWLVKQGYANKPLLKALLLENVLMAVMALLIGAAGILLAAGSLAPAVPFAGIQLPTVPTAAALLVLALAVGVGTCYRRARQGRAPVDALLKAALSYGVFFVLQAAAFLACYYIVTGTWALALGPVYLLSWLAGFLVVVAPAGIGVREAAFVFLAGTTVETGTAILAITLFRLISIVAEAGAFFMGLAIRASLGVETGPRRT